MAFHLVDNLTFLSPYYTSETRLEKPQQNRLAFHFEARFQYFIQRFLYHETKANFRSNLARITLKYLIFKKFSNAIQQFLDHESCCNLIGIVSLGYLIFETIFKELANDFSQSRNCFISNRE